MLLQNKNAIIYGAGGSLGRTISYALAKEGASVFVTGRNLQPVKKLANEINAAGYKAQADVVDALDQEAVNAFVKKVATEAGSVDISFSAISLRDVQGLPLADMQLADFIRPVELAMRSQFITATAAAKQMIQQQSGVILSLTATPGGIGYANVGGFGPACCAMESFSRDLASELGAYGVRVVNIRSGGSPDSRVFAEAIEHGGEKAASFIAKLAEDTMLKKLPLMQDIANTAVFLVSDRAGKITGVTIDVTCGTTAALNYKVTPIAFLQQQ